MLITRDMLADLIDETARERAAVETELKTMQKRFTELRETQERLQEEESAFRLAFDRRFPDDGRDDAGPELEEFEQAAVGLNGVWFAVPSEAWMNIPRTEAVERAIELATSDGQPYASPSDIERVLVSFGRSDSRDDIGGAIAHLNRSGKVKRLGRAQWVINHDD